MRSLPIQVIDVAEPRRATERIISSIRAGDPDAAQGPRNRQVTTSGRYDPVPDCGSERRPDMSKLRVHFLGFLTVTALLTPVPAADVKELFAIDLADYPGKEGRMIEVSYPPGGGDVVHRHDAHAFVYVLEGQIVMQLKGKPAVTLKAGETFYEGPTDIHVVGRNASSTKPARFAVVLLKAKGAPVLTPVEEDSKQ
jgi:quercetin dioxygenase-like cupin family protein